MFVAYRTMTTDRNPKRRTPKNDLVGQYLTEIGQIKMLSPEEEIVLGRKVRPWAIARQVEIELKRKLQRPPTQEELAKAVFETEKGHRPDQEEMKDFLPTFRERMKRGARAKDRMVEANLRLVVSIAKKYLDRGVLFQDLIQEGNIGLMRAVEKFDPEMGYKFSTYATWWVRQAVARAVSDKSRNIRLPIHVQEKLNKIRNTIRILCIELGRSPTEEEVATRLEMTISKFRLYRSWNAGTISLDIPVGKGDDYDLGDFMESGDMTPEESCQLQELREDVAIMLEKLTPKEREILSLRYGLQDGIPRTLQQISVLMGVTRERVRQIEQKAIRKLWHPNRSGELRDRVR